MADLVKDHKPNFVKAPKRCFEKTDGYYSDHDGDDGEESEEPQDITEGQSESLDNEMDEGHTRQKYREGSNYDQEDRDEAEKSMDTDDNQRKMDEGRAEADSFKKVTRAEWSKMTYVEKKQYLKERRRWKNRNTVYIKDDSDNEQLTDEEKDVQDEDLQFSDVSEDEKEKVLKLICFLLCFHNDIHPQEERLATEALKSYAEKFEPEQHPEDYKLVSFH